MERTFEELVANIKRLEAEFPPMTPEEKAAFKADAAKMAQEMCASIKAENPQNGGTA